MNSNLELPNFQKVRVVLKRTLFFNWLVAGAKICIGILTGALSILTDGFHSLFDGISNILGLAGIKMAEKPRDSAHPYGHQKFETLAAFGIAFLILITCFEFLKSAIERFIHPSFPEITILSFLVIAGCLGVDLFVYRYENLWGKRLKSEVLVADSFHTKAHVFTTSSLLLGMIGIELGLVFIDPLVSLFIIFALLKLAWGIIKKVVDVLTDRKFIDTKKIQAIASTIPGIEASHNIRTRGEEYYIYLDMHIALKRDLTLTRAHSISHQLEEKIRTKFPAVKDVVIHIEPKL